MPGGGPFDVADKRVVITGGTAGIGLGIAKGLVEAGAHVVITGRRPTGDAVARSIGAEFVRMDVTVETSVRQGIAEAVERLGGQLDCLVLNAGLGRSSGPAAKTNTQALERLLATNVIGVALGLTAAREFLSTGASVVVTSSPAAVVHMAGTAGYSASKAALDAFVKTAAIELGPDGIRINAIYPGIIETEMEFEEGAGAAELQVLRVLPQTSVVRKPGDLAPVVQFLASDASRTCTGGILACDDGLSAGLSQALLARAFGESRP
jgi:NAD(P)-dependent dehydrogenase (short-subunit alcohol dehydrogenase family)